MTNFILNNMNKIFHVFRPPKTLWKVSCMPDKKKDRETRNPPAAAADDEYMDLDQYGQVELQLLLHA